MKTNGTISASAGELSALPNRSLENQGQQMPTEYQAGGEAKDHQRNIVELPRPIATPIEQDREAERQHAGGKRCHRVDQSHLRSRSPWRTHLAQDAVKNEYFCLTKFWHLIDGKSYRILTH